MPYRSQKGSAMREYSDLPFGQWVRATWAGWILGICLIIAFALAGEAAGVGGAQVFVGAGIGMGVGFMQRRAMKGVLQQPGPWLWSCVIGLAVPFLVTDIANAAGWKLPFSLHACVAMGGLIVGAWQALILRQRLRRTELWTVASAVGWILAGGTAAVADALQRAKLLRGLSGAIAYLGII